MSRPLRADPVLHVLNVLGDLSLAGRSAEEQGYVVAQVVALGWELDAMTVAEFRQYMLDVLADYRDGVDDGSR